MCFALLSNFRSKDGYQVHDLIICVTYSGYVDLVVFQQDILESINLRSVLLSASIYIDVSN